MLNPSLQDTVVVDETGTPEVLHLRSDVSVTMPSEGQVLVKNVVSDVNFVDTYFRSGLYKSIKSEILGCEGAGIKYSEIRPCCWRSSVSVGVSGYAQHTAMEVEKVIKLPDGVSEQDAGAVTILRA